MSFLIGRWVIQDAANRDIIRGPAAILNGRRVGQAILLLAEYHSGIPPEPWFRVDDERSVGYKLELDAEAPRESKTSTSPKSSTSNTASDARQDAGGTPETVRTVASGATKDGTQ